jgi:hypothetical protein
MTPSWEALPACRRFVRAPSARNSWLPDEKLPAMPSACAVVAASRPSTEAAAAAAPKTPHTAVGCKQRR